MLLSRYHELAYYCRSGYWETTVSGIEWKTTGNSIVLADLWSIVIESI